MKLGKPLICALIALLIVHAPASSATSDNDGYVAGEFDGDTAEIMRRIAREQHQSAGAAPHHGPTGQVPSNLPSAAAPTHCSSYVPGLGGWVVDLGGCGNGLPANWIPDAPPPPGEPAPPGEAPAPEPEPIVITAEDLQRLPIQPGGLTTQPANGWVLVNVETIAMTGATEHDLITTILGSQVRVRVTPVDFTWDFGDGSPPLVTTDPGAPYPNHTVAHVYTQAHPSRTITLRTRWSGQFQVDGGPWQPVTGTATTTETSAPFEVRTARTALVTD